MYNKIELKKEQVNESFENVIVLSENDVLLTKYVQQHGVFYSQESCVCDCEYLQLGYTTILCVGVNPIKQKIEYAAGAKKALMNISLEVYTTIKEKIDLLIEIGTLIKRLEEMEE